MQSFFTVFFAGVLAFLGVLMMNPDLESQNEVYAETISMEVVTEPVATQSVMIEPVRPLVLALDAYHQFDAGMELPVDVLRSFHE